MVSIALLTVSDTRDIKNDDSGQFLVDSVKIDKHNISNRIICKDNVYIIWYSDFKENSKLEIQNLYRFLTVDTFFIPDVNINHNVFIMPRYRFVQTIYSVALLRRIFSLIFSKRMISNIKSFLFIHDNKPELSQEVKKRIQEYYFKDICSLEKLLDKNLESWKK